MGTVMLLLAADSSLEPGMPAALDSARFRPGIPRTRYSQCRYRIPANPATSYPLNIYPPVPHSPLLFLLAMLVSQAPTIPKTTTISAHRNQKPNSQNRPMTRCTAAPRNVHWRTVKTRQSRTTRWIFPEPGAGHWWLAPIATGPRNVPSRGQVSRTFHALFSEI